MKVHREDMQGGGTRVGYLKTRTGRDRCIGKGWARWTRSNVEIYKLEEPEEENTVLVGKGPPEEARTQPAELLQG